MDTPKSKKTDSGEYTISDLSRIYGVSLRTLRFYEDKGLLRPARKGTTRSYNASDRAHLECIIKGKQCGFSLFEIGRMIRGQKTREAREGMRIHNILNHIDPDLIRQQIGFLELRRNKISEALSELRAALKTQYMNMH